MAEQNAQNNQSLALVPMNRRNVDDTINKIQKILSRYKGIITLIINISMIISGYYSYNAINSFLFHLICIIIILIGSKNLLINFMKWYLSFYLREKAIEILDFLIEETRKPNSAYISQVKSILRIFRLLPPLENQENI